MGLRAFYALLVFLIFSMAASADEAPSAPTQGDVDAVLQRIQRAREALAKRGSTLNAQHQRSLLDKLGEVEKALGTYENLRRQGTSRQNATRPLYIAGAALLADDVTGIGTADDALVPFLGLGILGVYLVTHPPVLPAELARAWMQVIMALEEVGHAAGGIHLMAGSHASDIPKRKDCLKHLTGCLGTRLGRPGSGRSRGHSVCADCFEICQGEEKAWPDVGHDGKDCRWWNYP